MNVPRYRADLGRQAIRVPKGRGDLAFGVVAVQKNDNLSLSEIISSTLTDGMAEYLPPAMVPL